MSALMSDARPGLCYSPATGVEHACLPSPITMPGQYGRKSEPCRWPAFSRWVSWARSADKTLSTGSRRAWCSLKKAKGMNDRPTAAELVFAVREHLEGELIPTLADPRLRFQTLVAANVLRIVERELDA